MFALGNHTEDELGDVRRGWLCGICLGCISSLCLNLMLEKPDGSLWKINEKKNIQITDQCKLVIV